MILVVVQVGMITVQNEIPMFHRRNLAHGTVITIANVLVRGTVIVHQKAQVGLAIVLVRQAGVVVLQAARGIAVVVLRIAHQAALGINQPSWTG